MISVVIIARNEAHIIGNTLKSLIGISDDIVIVNNGSTDGTQDICKAFGARVVDTVWNGYGATKNFGNSHAKYDWILSLDADEAIDEQLLHSLKNFQPNSMQNVYDIAFRNYFCNKEIRFGVWGTSKRMRIFNKQHVQWNEDAVHEGLVLPKDINIKTMPGRILHYTVRDMVEFTQKTIDYARFGAIQYHRNGKTPSFIKLYVAPAYTFLYHYIIRLGFLDGWEGFVICKVNAWYSFMKYAFLRELIENDKISKK